MRRPKVDGDERKVMEAIASMSKDEDGDGGATEDRIMGRVGMSLGDVRSLLDPLQKRGLVLTGLRSDASETRMGLPSDVSRLTTAGKKALNG